MRIRFVILWTILMTVFCVQSYGGRKAIVTDTIDISPAARYIIESGKVPNPEWDQYTSFDDTIIVNPLYMPLAYDGRKLVKHIELNQIKRFKYDPNENFKLACNDTFLVEAHKLYVLRQSVKDRVFKEMPTKIKYDADSLPQSIVISKLEVTRLDHLIDVQPIGKPRFDQKVETSLPKFSFWKIVASSTIQLSQVYVSDNWYQGGESSFNVLNLQNLNMKYNDLKKINFSTDVVWKTNINSSSKDTLRSLRFGEDLFQINTQVGIKAFHKWDYSLSLLFKTQIFDNYKINTNSKVSSFLTPGELNLSLGMSYKLKEDKLGMDFNINLSPLSYNLKMALNPDINPSSLGIKEGKTLQKLGSSMQFSGKWQITREISWKPRFFFFTSYESTKLEMENTFEFRINRFFSTNIFIYPRFDDSYIKAGSKSFWQFKELLSFGFSHRW